MTGLGNDVHEWKFRTLGVVILAIAIGACGGSDSGVVAAGRKSAPDLGPMAPAAEGKPISFGIDGVELGMTEEEVKATWGEPFTDGDWTMEYRERGGYDTVELSGTQMILGMSLSSEDKHYQDEVMPELNEQFGPAITDPAELTLLRVGEGNSLFRAARYTYAIAHWAPDFDADEKVYLRKLQFVLHPGDLVRDIPKSAWASLRYPFPLALPESTKAEFKELLEATALEATVEQVEDVLGPPVWKHPGTLNRDAWVYIFWGSDTNLELFFTDGVLNGYEALDL